MGLQCLGPLACFPPHTHTPITHHIPTEAAPHHPTLHLSSHTHARTHTHSHTHAHTMYGPSVHSTKHLNVETVFLPDAHLTKTTDERTAAYMHHKDKYTLAK